MAGNVLDLGIIDCYNSIAMSSPTFFGDLPPMPGSLMDAVGRSQIVYDYYSPTEIREVRPTYFNEGSLALKGLIHTVDYDEARGVYTAHAALGNVAAHDNIRVVAGATQQFGFIPPSTFAHGFMGIYTKYYPRVDKTESNKVADKLRPDAEFEQFEEEETIGDALALRLTVVTTALARSIVHGLRSEGSSLRGAVSSGLFVPQMPVKRNTKSEYKITQ